MNLQTPEHPFMWIARKSHPTHFHNRYSRSSYQPKTNTEVLYDGSPEARAILGPTFEGDITIEGAGVRRHALDYLKGRDVERMGMWTYDIIQPDEPEDELEQLAISQMVMDRSVQLPYDMDPDADPAKVAAILRRINEEATEEKPKLVQITPAESNYESWADVKKELQDAGEIDEPTLPRC